MAETPTACPKCVTAILETVEDKGVPFLGCRKCFGLFVGEPDLFVYVEAAGTPRVFAAFVELHEKMLAAERHGSLRGCPHCGKTMARAPFGENPLVLLDRCPEHGVWLDRTELKKLIRACRASSGVVENSLDGEDDDDDASGPLEGKKKG